MKKSGIIYYLAKAGMAIAMPIFAVVAGIEHLIARIFHLTYNEVNILVYYLFIPLSWAAMIDCIIGIPILSILFSAMWGYIFYKTRKDFSYYCDIAFHVSQIFLLSFGKTGLNYIVSSVIICVIIPLLIYIGLYSLI